MIRALYASATGMKAQEMLLDATANNIANVNTNGFKRSHVDFADLMYATVRSTGTADSGPPVGLQLGNGTRAVNTTKLMTQGAINQTGEPTHIAIEGDGFFRVLLPDGSERYTRDGAFHQNANGLLVNGDGYALADQITLPAGSKLSTLNISPQGLVQVEVSGTATDIGQIQVATFQNPAGLSSEGGNLYAATAASGTVTPTNPTENGAGGLRQRSLEQANVEVVTELVSLITAQRAYEVNARAIRAGDEMLSVTNQIVR